MKKNDRVKVVILCGGRGSRLGPETDSKPKPMVEIGNRPILWHIMKTYAHYGLNDFILCLGYQGWIIKEFFLNYTAKICDIGLTLGKHNLITYHTDNAEAGWKITLAETGENAQTGARIWNVREYLKDCDIFCLTYGDGVSDINLKRLIGMHKKSGLLGTITGVHPLGRFGELERDGNLVSEFNEKPNVSSGLINGGFMVFDKKVINRYFKPGEDLILEKEVLSKMVKDRQLGIYQHDGFWYCIDTPREYVILNEMWKNNNAPWKVW